MFDVADATFDNAAEHDDSDSSALDYLERNRAAWDELAAAYLADGRRAWHDHELRWGLWRIPESELRLLDGFASGEDAIELGCGTGAVSAWLSRRGLRPVAVDFTRAQIRNVESLQSDFDLRFPVVRANAEQVPFDGESFDLAISEYGASLWCNPRRWLPEANRLLRPEGRLIFITNSALLLTCTPLDGSAVGRSLIRDHFSRDRVEFAQDGPVEFHLTHGQWIRLLRESGFVLDDLIEVQADSDAEPRFHFVSSDWAHRWPSEEIWVAHKTRDA